MTGCTQNGAVYFARAGRYVKIGFATNPRHRAETLLSRCTRLHIPEDLDRELPVDLILVIPFCRIRDERNMQLLFANHWAEGEWFHWSPAFERQMRGMSFVTHAVRRKWLTEHRKVHGGIAHAKEERWGMQTPDLLAHLAEWRREHASLLQAA